ncbi:MAG: beta-glucosidase [Clostridiales bacterium]|jgi:beta-glucosidase|nr:GH1 family beta-glucosidase [Bacillota bacterium]NLK04572.1 beta-glucosidase [Clostridiales bacterium]
MSFTKDFIWGAASASYQIEGAAYEGGRALSVWDTFSHTDGKIKNNDNGDIACNHYHLYKEDVQLMKELGIKAYRFSISWSRILPNGTGKVNEEGLKFYSDLVDELLKAGITPYITLFHWDLPQAIYYQGGWRNRDIADWFAQYTKVVVDALSDRVSHWITLNEPMCHILLGHHIGNHAPGEQNSVRESFRLLHNMNLAHGKAVETIRKHSKSPATIGIAPNPHPGVPVTNKKEDIEAARLFSLGGNNRGIFSNGWWLDPVLLGKYPEDGVKAMGKDFPSEMIQDGDMELMSPKLDFLGLNLYYGTLIRHDDTHGFATCPREIGYPQNALKWHVLPEILYYMPKFLYEKYKLPIIITENGLTLPDWVSLDGKVHDPNRIDYMHRYLKELKKASKEGVDIRGYFAWSILDNFEWAEGYNERFGLIYVDYQTQKRIPKDSYYWYNKLIASNGKDL